MKTLLLVLFLALLPSTLALAEEGNAQHTFPLEAIAWHDVAIDGDAALILGRDRRTRTQETYILESRDLESGEALWSARVHRLTQSPYLHVASDVIVVYAFLDVVGLNKANGEELWRIDLDKDAFLMGYDAESVTLFTQGKITRFHAADGKPASSHDVPGDLADVIYGGRVIDTTAVLDIKKGDLRSLVALNLKEGSTQPLLLEDGPEAATLGMIFAEGARSPLSLQRAPYALGVRSSEQAVWLEAAHLSGKTAWTWEFEDTTPQAFIEKAAQPGSAYLHYEYDKALLVTSISEREGAQIRLDAFELSDRSPVWTLDIEVPDEARIASLQELDSGAALVMIRGGGREAWYRHLLISAEGELLWQSPEPLLYPEARVFDGERFVEIVTPFGPNSAKAKAGEKRTYALRVTVF